MKKLLSLLAILGLAGFVIAPIYAQEEDAVALDEEPIAAEAEVVEDEDVAAEEVAIDDELAAEEDVALEATDEETAIEDEYNLDDVNFNDIFEDEEVQNALAEAGLTNEEAAWLLGGALGLFAGVGIVGIIIAIVWGILAIVAMWKIFTKAGEAGWKSIIPIYNVYIMYKIVGMKNWFWYTLIAAFVWWLIAWFLWEESSAGGIVTLISSLFSGIVGIVAAYKLPRKFGWGVFASILYVLFTAICILILGFGNYKYQGKEESTVVEA